MWIHPGPGSVPSHFVMGLRLPPCPVKVSSMQTMNCVANNIHFEITCLCQKRVELLLYSSIIGWTVLNIHALLANLWAVFVQVFMPCWNFEHIKAVNNLHCGKSGRWHIQDSATEVTILG